MHRSEQREQSLALIFLSVSTVLSCSKSLARVSEELKSIGNSDV